MPETPRQPDEREIDALLDDVKQLLGDEPESKPAPPQTSAPRASDVHIDYEKFYGEIPPDPAPSRVPDAPTQVFQPLTAYEQSKPAYQTARRALYEKQREQERLAREQERQAREAQEEQAVQALEQKKKRRRADLEQTAPMDSAAYAQWLYEQGDGSETREHRRVAAEFAEENSENAPKSAKNAAMHKARRRRISGPVRTTHIPPRQLFIALPQFQLYAWKPPDIPEEWKSPAADPPQAAACPIPWLPGECARCFGKKPAAPPDYPSGR